MYRPVLSALSLLAVCGSASAFQLRCRFVERIGAIDIVLPGNRLDACPFIERNIRIQFGVFEDASGPAPAGGFLGWNIGTLTISQVDAATQWRNPGRIAPFTFSQHPNANGNPPAPAGDPFTSLTEIDSTLGTQSRAWVCDAQGTVPPQPAAPVRGLNTYVSIYAFRTRPGLVSGYTITATGNLIGATGWQTVGTPVAPDCGNPSDPSDDIAGSVTYAPIPTAPQPFSCVLDVSIPSPAVNVALGVGSLMVLRRRRSR